MNLESLSKRKQEHIFRYARLEMVWYCLRCGRKNVQEAGKCSKCDLEKELAQTFAVVKRLRMCEECGHIHREGYYCHVYTEAADKEMVDDVVSDSEPEEEEESDSDNSSVGGKNNKNAKNAKSNKVQAKSRAALAKAKAKAAKAKAMKIRPLATPDYVKAVGYLRCNCKEGVPMDCLKYEPVPQMVMVDIIQIQTYVEIMDPGEKTRYWSQVASKRTETAKSKKRLEETNSVANNLPHILSYLHYGQCWAAAVVSRSWNAGANFYKEYVDIRNFVPYQIYRPHLSSVDALLLGHTIIYSAGDYRISATDLYSGEHCSVVARDSGGFKRMIEYEENLYCCSTNGSIRAYGLTHTGRNLALVNTMWEHSKSVQDYICSIPSDGPCVSHGITDHICYFFSCSEDRSAKVWSTSKQQCIRSIASDALRAATFTRLAVSNRHIFAGTTAASIAVFSAYAICERDDVHLCNVANQDPTYCLQITLKLPKNLLVSGHLPWITGLLCPQIGPEFPNLWAADASGQLTIWYVPREGLEFTPAYTVKAHHSAINDLQKTWRHVISIGDDGLVVLHDIIGFYRVRTVDVMYYCLYYNLFQSTPHVVAYKNNPYHDQIPRRIKCLYVKENYETGGTLLLGTSYGEVVIISLGTTV